MAKYASYAFQTHSFDSMPVIKERGHLPDDSTLQHTTSKGNSAAKPYFLSLCPKRETYHVMRQSPLCEAPNSICPLDSIGF